MTLDGELFCGRGQFNSCVSIVKTSGSSRWGEVKYQVSIVVLMSWMHRHTNTHMMIFVSCRSSTRRPMEASPLRPAWIVSVLSLEVFSQHLLTSSLWTRPSSFYDCIREAYVRRDGLTLNMLMLVQHAGATVTRIFIKSLLVCRALVEKD